MKNKNRNFVITNGSKYIRKNLNDKYEMVSDLSIADTYSTLAMAATIVKNELTYSQKLNFYVGEIRGSEIIQHTAPLPRADRASKKQMENTENDITLSYASEWQDENLENWFEIISNFKTLVQTAVERGKVISSELSNIDEEIKDIAHLIEFKDLNACNSCKIGIEQKKALRKRRQLCNEKQIISQILSSYDMINDVSKLYETVKHLRERVYIPRKRVDLFEKYA